MTSSKSRYSPARRFQSEGLTPYRSDGDPHLAGPSMGLINLDDMQDLGDLLFTELNRLHESLF